MGRTHTPSVPLGLVLVRIVAGAVILLQGWDWLSAGGLDGAAVRGSVSSATSDLPVPVAWWGDAVLLANADATAFFWRWGTFLIGLGFVAGGLVRTAGLLGVLFALHGLLFAGEEHTRLLLLLSVCLVACAAAGAGQRLGVDALVEDRLPSWLTLRKKSSSSFLG